MQSTVVRKSRFRFSVKALAVAVALCALACTVVVRGIPWITWKYRVHRALEASLANGPAATWGSPGSASRDALADLMSDRERVIETLLQALENDREEYSRRYNASEALRDLLKQPDGDAFRERCFERICTVCTNSKTQEPLSSHLVRLVGLTRPLDLTTQQREAILARAGTTSASYLGPWIRLLAAIGGHEETGFVLTLADRTNDPELSNAVYRSSLRDSEWPGLLPHVKTWLATSRSDELLSFRVLFATPEGRRILADYALNPSCTPEQRRRVIDQLAGMIDGIKLLLDRANDPESLNVLRDALGVDPRERLLARMENLRVRGGSRFWTDLIRILDANSHLINPNAPAEAHRRPDSARAVLTAAYAKALRIFSGRSDLRTPAEWQSWYDETQPGPIPPEDVANQLVAHPDLFPALMRRLVTPEDCEMSHASVIAYLKLARVGTAEARFWACRTLLLTTDNEDAVPLVFDLFDPRHPDQNGALIELLRTRFAENYFSDVEAWRKWWEQR